MPGNDVLDYSWTIINRFKNTSFVSKYICDIHSIPKSQINNVKKQAIQIRQCLIQAEEYFKAARTVSLATRPLLLYYGTMSFALAEILLKQSGDSSLDRARGAHAHHGLDLRISSNPSKVEDLAGSGSLLRAVPMKKSDGSRYGTFELWHRSSRESPICATFENTVVEGSNTSETNIIALPNDTRPELLPSSGMSLLQCFQNVPRMTQLLSDHKIETLLARGVYRSTSSSISKKSTYTLIIHPTPLATLEKTYERIHCHPSGIDSLEIVELAHGCIIRQRFSDEVPAYGLTLPNSFQDKVSEFTFCADNESLNEFGTLYVGLFILGNYARYFPDFWMVDVEYNTDLMLAAAKFLEISQNRIPTLACSELSRRWLLEES